MIIIKILISRYSKSFIRIFGYFSYSHSILKMGYLDNKKFFISSLYQYLYKKILFFYLSKDSNLDY